MFHNQITIMKAANGFIVILPPPHPGCVIHPTQEQIDNEVRRQARIAREEFNRDEILDKIKAEAEAEEKQSEIKNPHTQENIFCFQKWEQVVNFLSVQFNY